MISAALKALKAKFCSILFFIYMYLKINTIFKAGLEPDLDLKPR